MGARDELVNRNTRLAIKAARRYYHICARADLDQAAMLGLIKAARTYDPGRVPPVKFSTYAMICITRELKALIRGQRKGDGLPDDIEDTSESVSARSEEAELYAGLGQALASLTPLEQALVVERFGLGGKPAISRVALSMMTGIGLDRIRAIEHAATEKLRAYMDVDTEDECTSIQDDDVNTH